MTCPLSTARLTPKLAAISIAAGLLSIAGCTTVEAPPLASNLPASFAQAPANASTPGASAVTPDLRGWWKVFNDSQLNALVDEALAANLEVAQARSRFIQARLVSGVAYTRYLPQVTANMQPTQDAAAVNSYLHASLDANWELGLFGDREATDQTAKARIQDAAGALQAARVTVVAEVVHRYIELRTAQAQLALVSKMNALDDRAAKLAEVRVRNRLGSLDEAALAQARVDQTAAQTAPLRQSVVQASQALAVLLGRTAPDKAWSTDNAAIPKLPSETLQTAVVPADLLRVRPDLQQAEAQVVKAAGEAGLAKAQLYPRVSIGLSYLAAYNLTENRRVGRASDLFPRLGPFIDVPVFDWGRRRAEADAALENLDESVLGYRQTVLQALAETETALGALQSQRDRATKLQSAQSTLARRVKQLNGFSSAGLSSEYDSLAVVRAQMQTDSDLLEAQSGQAVALVGLYKALGGAPLPPELMEKGDSQ